eukprot:COSAG04_NODE_659_length_11458_cov_3.404173_4_plen_127_part_00
MAWYQLMRYSGTLKGTQSTCAAATEPVGWGANGGPDWYGGLDLFLDDPRKVHLVPGQRRGVCMRAYRFLRPSGTYSAAAFCATEVKVSLTAMFFSKKSADWRWGSGRVGGGIHTAIIAIKRFIRMT